MEVYSTQHTGLYFRSNDMCPPADRIEPLLHLKSETYDATYVKRVVLLFFSEPPYSVRLFLEHDQTHHGCRIRHWIRFC